MRWAAAVALLCATSVAAVPGAQKHPQQAPWRRLTNNIISQFWRPEAEKTVPKHSYASGTRSGRLAARYGQDIVLRFNVSTAAEAIAIADASEDLYLDVWEFNEGWVDIRLAKEVVCSTWCPGVASSINR
jgi:extracellular matrix protein 14